MRVQSHHHTLSSKDGTRRAALAQHAHIIIGCMILVCAPAGAILGLITAYALATDALIGPAQMAMLKNAAWAMPLPGFLLGAFATFVGTRDPSATALPDPVAEDAPPAVLSRAERHARLSLEYGEYRTDPVRVLREPLLSDVRDPYTAEFVEAYARLTELPDNTDAPTHEEALTRAWKACRAACAQSRRVGLSQFDPTERKRLQRAQHLLTMALDAASTSPERSLAYAEAKKLIDGPVELPAESRMALSNRREALPA